MLPDKILDAVADESPLKKDNNLLLLNKLDFGINAFLLIVAASLGLISIFEPSILLFLAFCNFCIGIYQLISAIVGSLRGNKHKRDYLIIAIVYLMLLWLGSFSGDRFFSAKLESVILVAFILVIPLLGAAYYTYMCYEAKNSI